MLKSQNVYKRVTTNKKGARIASSKNETRGRRKNTEFLVLRSMKPEGKKILKIKMEDLASLIDETRINVSKVLNDLQEQGLVQLSRKEISIPALEKLTEKNK